MLVWIFPLDYFGATKGFQNDNWSYTFKNGSFHPMSEGYKCCLEDEEENVDSRTSLFHPG